MAAKVSPRPAVPTVVGMALWYVKDNDYAGAVPFLALQVRWDLEKPLGKS